MSECGQGGGSRRQICVSHSLVITDKSNSEPAGGQSSHNHHGGPDYYNINQSIPEFLFIILNFQVRFWPTGKLESLWTTEDKYLTEELLCQNIWRVLTPLLWILSYCHRIILSAFLRSMNGMFLYIFSPTIQVRVNIMNIIIKEQIMVLLIFNVQQKIMLYIN